MGTVYKFLYPVASAISWVFMNLVDAVFDLLYKDKCTSVSKVTDPILLQPAVVLADKIRSREYRAEDVMTAFISRAKEVNPLVNAIIGDQYDQALRTAQQLDRSLDELSADQIDKEYSRSSKPFLGVPLSVKEAFSWKGMGRTSGVVSRKCLRCDDNAPVLDKLIEAGAIPFVQTNVSELCMWYESSNYVHGCTNNAYNTSKIVGGSSGGEGCIISSGGAVIGIGSDIGGSIRMPCFFNGIFGHKCTVGIVENTGQWPIAGAQCDDLLATGPMCRYVDDLIPQLKVMAGPEPIAKLKLDTKVDLSKVRVISVSDDGKSLLVSNMDQQLKSIQRKASRYLEKQGAQVSEKCISKFRLAVDMWAARLNLADKEPKFSMLMTGCPETGEKVNCIKELALWFLHLSNHTLPAIMLGIVDEHLPKYSRKMDLKAVRILEVLKEEMLELLGDDGVLLYPSHPTMAPYHNRPIFTPFNFAYTCLFNALNLPVTQCPLGLSKQGLPMGIQVVASPYNDHLCLAVAKSLDQGFGGWASPGQERDLSH